MPKSSLLYLMHVSWGWIKQRPHFLAEGLAQKFDVTVFYSGKKTESKNKYDLTIKPFPNPFPGGKKYISLLNYLYRKLYFTIKLKKYTYIWLSFPNQFSLVKDAIKQHHILIYDCMDDALEIYTKKQTNEKLALLEKNIVERANLIFVSALSLQQKLVERYGQKDNIHVVNNAITNPEKIQLSELPTNIKRIVSDRKNTKKLFYIGTISKWMDFELLLISLKEIESLEIFLIGPLDTEFPVHERLIHIPPIDHSLVFSLMNHADALVMPFVLNNLILGVNPVKAYEYIYSGKPVIMKAYPETYKFKDYIYLYETRVEFISLMHNLSKENLRAKVSIEEARKFIKKNTWEKRVETIVDIIEKYDS